MRLLFDIESDGLLDSVTTVWMLVIKDLDTGTTSVYTDHANKEGSVREGLDKLSQAKILIGHNIIGYDLIVLKRLYNWKPNRNQVVYDTWLMSLILQYKRGHAHSLEGWGSKLGYPKFNFSEFHQYSEAMVHYCVRDIELNEKVYIELVKEAKLILKKNPLILKGIEVEMQFAMIEADIREKGWNFDVRRAEELLREMESRLKEIEDTINPLIGLVCVKVDKVGETKKPSWKKNGEYSMTTCKYWNITPESGQAEDRLVEGEYCRVAFEPGNLGSDKVLKSWLYSLGWVPDEWNVERINGNFVKKSPKLTDTSLEPLGDIGKQISEYNSLSNRHGVLKGWLEQLRGNRLHGRMWTIGTPTMRCRHEVIANLPTVGTLYGEEMRSLLLPDRGKVIIGADSAGNQMRGLCHYIGNKEFTHEVINGDVHTRNAQALAEFTDGVPNRKRAKPFLYAFLFGGGAGKLALILTDKRDDELGKRALAKFESSVPGLGELKEELSNYWNRTKKQFGEENAFIRGIDGRMLFVSSKHKILVSLLQSLEGLTCKAAAVYLRDKLLDENIEFDFLLHYHDELAVQVEEHNKERVMKLAIEAFTEAPKWFGVECMSGDAKSGVNYAEVH